MRGTTAHMARRDLFTSGLEMEKSELISRKEAMRESAERISQNKRVSERVWWSNTKVPPPPANICGHLMVDLRRSFTTDITPVQFMILNLISDLHANH